MVFQWIRQYLVHIIVLARYRHKSDRSDPPSTEFTSSRTKSSNLSNFLNMFVSTVVDPSYAIKIAAPPVLVLVIVHAHGFLNDLNIPFSRRDPWNDRFYSLCTFHVQDCDC